MKLHKKAVAATAGFLGLGWATSLIIVIVLLVIFLGIPTAGILKFVFFQDKTPLILGGLLILLYLGKKKRERH